MTPRRAVKGWSVLLACVLVAALASCGADGSRSTGAGSTPGTRTANEAGRVIRAWVDTLRRGDVTKAASYFAVPAIVQNGTPPIELTSRGEVIGFNASLPCGARLLRTYASGRYTTAVFRLTERPGAGRCGQGTGQTARTRFVVRHGKIREWRRVADELVPSAPSAPVV
jgi:hypothetical protein